MIMTTCKELTEPDLECSICKQLFTKPITLTCGHTFCCGCLVKYAKKKDEALSLHAIPCAVCRKWNTVPVGNTIQSVEGLVAYFSPNIALQNLVESAIKRQQEPVSLHQRRTFRRCPEHPDEKFKLFCRTCDKPICAMCGAITHKECKGVVPLPAKLEELKSFVTEEAEKFNANMSMVKDFLSSTEKNREDLLAQCKQMKQDIKQQANLFKDAISKNEDKLLKQLEDFRRKNESEMDSTVESARTDIKRIQEIMEKNQTDDNFTGLEAYEYFKSQERDVTNARAKWQPSKMQSVKIPDPKWDASMNSLKDIKQLSLGSFRPSYQKHNL